MNIDINMLVELSFLLVSEKLLCANGDNPLSSVIGIKTVDINDLARGVYFLNAYSGTDVQTLRFIVTEK